MKITRRQLRQIIRENGDTDPSDGWPSTRPDTSDPEYNPLRPSTPPPDPDELDFSEEGGLIDYERMKREDREMYDALIHHKKTNREFRLDHDLLPFAKDAAAEEKIKKAIAKATTEIGLKEESKMKITRRQLRQIIKEEIDRINEDESNPDIRSTTRVVFSHDDVRGLFRAMGVNVSGDDRAVDTLLGNPATVKSNLDVFHREVPEAKKWWKRYLSQRSEYLMRKQEDRYEENRRKAQRSGTTAAAPMSRGEE